jgi:cobalt-zinc-cadmium efflux system membrane fusion protein
MRALLPSNGSGTLGQVMRAMLAVAACALAGCAKDTPTPSAAPPGESGAINDAQQASPKSSTDAAPGHHHQGWWCAAHGVPEAECGQCDARLAARFQSEGDWCPEHDRPDSQCFICHPEQADRFAARYEARYGTPPPPRSE